jgi:lysophospholipase L1-like esterase
MQPFSAYIALGDSISIDAYPALDLGLSIDAPVGAASLLHSNQAKYWPDFEGRDLSTLYPGIAFTNLTEDGATTWDLLDGGYLKFIQSYTGQRVLMTVTIGGNDALRMLAIEGGQPAKLTAEAAGIVDRYQKVLDQLRSNFPKAVFILNTIYDPSDGIGIMPGYEDFADKLPLLRYLNDQIREYARANNCLLADIHNHFHGHGPVSSPFDCWYWRQNPIEPSASGASNLRALWLQVLGSEP